MSAVYRYAGQDTQVSIEQRAAGYRAVIDGLVYDFEVIDSEPGSLILRLGDRLITLYVAAEGDRRWVAANGCTYYFEKSRQARRAVSAEAGSARQVRAPMPAQVREVRVREGDLVEKGQTLLLLEAMKMEIRLQAPHGGRVARLLASAGSQVDRDQVLVELEEA